MTTSAIIDDPIIHDVVMRLVTTFQPLKIVLFGSRARGDARPDSDLDLLVVMPDGTNRRDATVAMMRRLADVPIAKEIVVTTPLAIDRRFEDVASVLVPAIEEGRVLHERA